MEEIVNVKEINKLINEFKNFLEDQKNELEVYIIAFADIRYSDTDAELEVELFTLYQYLENEITDFIDSDYRFTNSLAFKNLFYELFMNNACIYKMIGSALVKRFYTDSYGFMGIICKKYKLHKSDDRNVEYTVGNADKYLYNVFDIVCKFYLDLWNLYSTVEDREVEESMIKRNIHSQIDKIVNDKQSQLDAKGLIDFYDYLYKCIDKYTIKENSNEQ